MNREHITYIKILCNLVLFALTSILVIWGIPRLFVFFMPFFVAWIISCIATPIVRLVEKHLRLKRKMSMVFVVVLIISIIISAFYGAGIQSVKFIAGFLEDLPYLWERMRQEAHATLELLLHLLNKVSGSGAEDVETFLATSGDAVTRLVGELSAPTISAVGNFARRVPDLLMFTIMCVLSTYFFVVERENLIAKLHIFFPKSFLRVWEVIRRCVVSSIGGYFKAQFKIEFWIYLLVYIGLKIVGVDYAALIALGIAILDLLPVFGTGAVLWPWTLVEVINGDYFQAVGLMIIWGLSQLVRQFIQPKFVGDTLGVEPLPTLLLLFTGYKIAGVFGMIIAVPLGILVITLYREGVFNTTEQSLCLLAGRLSKFRQYDEEELKELEEYKKSSEE